MTKISRRAILSMIIAFVLLGGLIVFLIMYFADGSAWAMYPSNAHVYSQGNLNTGRIIDSEGLTLVETVDGVRQYNSDAAVRIATLHVAGDRYGNIATDVQSRYLDKLAGFDYLNGLYNLTGKGNDVILTLSAEVCSTAYKALNGRKGTVGVYNYETCEIICMVSAPSFDPDNIPDIEGNPAYEGAYINRLLSSNYVPGSIFKLVTAAAAIENIDDIYEQQFYCDGSIMIEGDTVNCSGVHGTVGFRRALAVSCNVAFSQIALQLGADTLTKYAEKAGLNSSLEFNGLSTATGHFDLSDAASSDIAWSSIGQYTDTVNPYSYMVYMGAIANGGVVPYPHLVERVRSASGFSFGSAKAETGERILSEETAAVLADMMSNNVAEVYGEYNFPGLDLCAKSGTAEVGGGLLPNSMFTGFIRNPDYPLAFIVVVQNGGDGSTVAGSVANTVLQKAIEVLGRDGNG